MVANTMNVTTRFTQELVSLAKSYFADYAMISLHGLRIFLGKSYEMSLDILATMTPILEEIGLEPAVLPHPSTLCEWFDRLKIDVWRVLLRHSAQLHNPSDHVAVDATYYDRSRASKHYCQRTNYRVQTLEATKLVDTDSQAILDVHCTTTKKGSNAEVCAKLARRYVGELRVLAADKGYDSRRLRKILREDGIRPLIKHRVHAPYDHAHNARIDDELYGQRSMTETVNSSVKRSLGVSDRGLF